VIGDPSRYDPPEAVWSDSRKEWLVVIALTPDEAEDMAHRWLSNNVIQGGKPDGGLQPILDVVDEARELNRGREEERR
jgi:hypothetical protein